MLKVIYEKNLVVKGFTIKDQDTLTCVERV